MLGSSRLTRTKTADDDEDESREDDVREHPLRGGATGDDDAHGVADRDADADHRRDTAATGCRVAVGHEGGRGGLDGVDPDLDDEPHQGHGQHRLGHREAEEEAAREQGATDHPRRTTPEPRPGRVGQGPGDGLGEDVRDEGDRGDDREVADLAGLVDPRHDVGQEDAVAARVHREDRDVDQQQAERHPAQLGRRGRRGCRPPPRWAGQVREGPVSAMGVLLARGRPRRRSSRADATQPGTSRRWRLPPQRSNVTGRNRHWVVQAQSGLTAASRHFQGWRKQPTGRTIRACPLT